MEPEQKVSTPPLVTDERISVMVDKYAERFPAPITRGHRIAGYHFGAKELRDLYEAHLSEVREENRRLREALDTAHRVMLYRDWNQHGEDSLEHGAFNAANRIINPHHYPNPMNPAMDNELKYDTPEKRRKIAMRETEGQSLAKAAGYVEALRYDAAPLEARLADQDKLIGDLVEALENGKLQIDYMTGQLAGHVYWKEVYNGKTTSNARELATAAVDDARYTAKNIGELLTRIRTKAGNNKNLNPDKS